MQYGTKVWYADMSAMRPKSRLTGCGSVDDTVTVWSCEDDGDGDDGVGVDDGNIDGGEGRRDVRNGRVGVAVVVVVRERRGMSPGREGAIVDIRDRHWHPPAVVVVVVGFIWNRRRPGNRDSPDRTGCALKTMARIENGERIETGFGGQLVISQTGIAGYPSSDSD